MSSVKDETGSGFSMDMYDCYKQSESLKDFCDDIFELGYQQDWTTTELIDCYSQFSDSFSSTQLSEVSELKSQVKCDSEATIEAKYKCLGKKTASLDFCYDKYVNTEITDQQIDECIEANVVDPKFD